MADKFCKDCKHLLSETYCGKDIRSRGNYYVSGDPQNIDYYYASVSRHYGCGPKGNWFEPKELPKPKPTFDLGDGPIIEHSDEPPQKKKSLFQKLIGR